MTTANSKKTKYELYEEFRCRECDQFVCWATSSRTGKTYLAVPTRWESDAETSSNGKNNKKIFYPAHDCQPTEEVKAEMAAAKVRAQEAKYVAVAQGRFVVGQAVTIVKGKKFPIGTEGVVFWIATEKKFDSYSCGIETTSGERIFVDIKNIVVTSTGKKVCSTCVGTGFRYSEAVGRSVDCLMCEGHGTSEVAK